MTDTATQPTPAGDLQRRAAGVLVRMLAHDDLPVLDWHIESTDDPRFYIETPKKFPMLQGQCRSVSDLHVWGAHFALEPVLATHGGSLRIYLLREGIGVRLWAPRKRTGGEQR